MLARLGNVIYWASCLGVAAIAFFAVQDAIAENPYRSWNWEDDLVPYVIGGALLWLFGRAAQYVLANK